MFKAATSKLRNIFSVDVEDLDAMNFDSMEKFRGTKFPSRVYDSTSQLLDLLAEKNSQATLFFLGTVAEQFPALVRRAQAEGHEIASHGYAHELVYRQTRTEFYDDVKRSVDILQAITGEPISGYRAPCWSISRATPWAYDVLADLGLTYDASLFPFRTYLYGDENAPLSSFVHQLDGRELHELPATALSIAGRRFPFGGGFYLRAMPWFVTWMGTWLVNREGRPVVFYIHPREIDPAQPRYDLPWKDRLIAYLNLGSTLKKLTKILDMGGTITIRDYLASRHCAARPTDSLSVG